jgi:hypothetical protein
MHSQKLVLNHAFGLKEHTKNKKAIDSFVAGKNIRNKVITLYGAVMERKTKGRFR